MHGLGVIPWPAEAIWAGLGLSLETPSYFEWSSTRVESGDETFEIF